MIYKVQHNGKGKAHLLDEALNPLCGYNGSLNFFDSKSLKIEDQLFFEITRMPAFSIYEGTENIIEIPKHMADAYYCKKCLRKQMKINRTKNP